MNKGKKHQSDLRKQSIDVEGSKKYIDILSRVIHEGEETFKLNKKTIFLSACIAGLELALAMF